MNSIHRIRIRGPWQRRVASAPNADNQNADDTAQVTVTMPRSWTSDLGSHFQGEVVYSRYFNRPTNIDAATQIRLAFDEIVGDALVTLNDQSLGSAAWPVFPVQFDVTGLLRDRNFLVVRVTALAEDELRRRQTQLGSPGQQADVDDPSDDLPDGVEGGMVGEVRLEIG